MPPESVHIIESIKNAESPEKRAEILNGIGRENGPIDRETFTGLTFVEITSPHLRFASCTFEGCTFERSTLRMSRCTLMNCTLMKCKFDGNTDKSNWTNVECDDCRLPNGANRVRWVRVTMRDSQWEGARAEAAVFDRLVVLNSRLFSLTFTGSEFRDCDLRGAIFNGQTHFLALRSAAGTRISRFALLSLGDKRGDLTLFNLSEMDVEDDVAALRQQFSGFWTWLHLIAILIFIAPYVWFLSRIWVYVRLTPPSEGTPTISVCTALCRYIVNGGHQWANGWHPSVNAIVLFVFFLIFNAMRIALMLKTKHLEMKQETVGVPVRFTFAEHEFWRLFYWFNKVFMYGAYLVGILNAWKFLSLPIAPEALLLR